MVVHHPSDPKRRMNQLPLSDGLEVSSHVGLPSNWVLWSTDQLGVPVSRKGDVLVVRFLFCVTAVADVQQQQLSLVL